MDKIFEVHLRLSHRELPHKHPPTPPNFNVVARNESDKVINVFSSNIEIGGAGECARVA